MASAPSMSVSVECVNLCKLSKGEGAGGRYECSVLSCAWKAPRALTGFLASTTQPQCALHDRNNERRFRMICARSSGWRCKDWNSAAGDSAAYGRLAKSRDIPIGRKGWKLWCSSISPESFDRISPETLWEDLKPSISYLPPSELTLVKNALKLAFEAHDGQKRRSGEPFIIHPVEVARIVGELELDWECIAAGLLHDTVEDTDVVTFEKIEKEFGATVRHIVEGETKVSKLGKLQCSNENNSVQDVKADDLRQMFLAMTEEVRVIIVKLADRLHNMRSAANYQFCNRSVFMTMEILLKIMYYGTHGLDLGILTAIIFIAVVTASVINAIIVVGDIADLGTCNSEINEWRSVHPICALPFKCSDILNPVSGISIHPLQAGWIMRSTHEDLTS